MARKNSGVKSPPISVCLSSPDCVKILDDRGFIQFFNEDGLRQMEIDDPSAVIGVYWPLLWPEDTRAALEEALVGARQAGVASLQAFCPTAKGAARWWDLTIATLPGAATQFVVVSKDITDSRADRARETLDRDRLESILRSNTDVLWDIDLQAGTVWWGEGMQTTFGYTPDQIGESAQWRQERIHPEDREIVTLSMLEAVSDGAATWEGEFRFRKADGEYLNVHDRGAIVHGAGGEAVRFVGVMQDVTARTVWVDAQKVIFGELAHRANNTLAVVNGLFQNSVRNSAGRDSLVDTFGGRLIALANANTAVLRGEGAASLHDIARAHLAPFAGADRLQIRGPKVLLPESLAQPFALALNELATNAIKYGALSNTTGKVDLSWAEKDSGEKRALILEWTESGGPLVQPPTRAGMGSRLIEKGIRNARVERRFEPDGFHCRIEAPLG